MRKNQKRETGDQTLREKAEATNPNSFQAEDTNILIIVHFTSDMTQPIISLG
jgi:hypothetical protein